MFTYNRNEIFSYKSVFVDILTCFQKCLTVYLTHCKYKTAGSALIWHITNTRQLVRRSSDTLQIQDSWFGAHLTHCKCKTAGSALIWHIAHTRQLVRRSSTVCSVQSGGDIDDAKTYRVITWINILTKIVSPIKQIN